MGLPTGILGISRDITKRRKREKEIETLKKQTEFILGATRTGLDIIDSQFNLRYIDPAWQKIYGNPAGRKCHEYFMDRDTPCPGCGISEALKTKSILVTEERLPKEGNRPIQVTTIPFQAEDGDWMVAEVNVDITERIRMEEALEKSVQLLNVTGEMAQIGGWEIDLSTKEVSWTEEVGRIHGVGPGYKPKLEEALNFYAPESRPAVEALLKKAAETGEPYNLESLFIPLGSKDKIWVRSLGRAVYNDDGTIVKLAGTFQNIDKYKKAEETLRETNEYLHKLIDYANAPIMVWDPAFRITRFNEAFEHLTGRTEQEVLGQMIEILFPAECRDASLALIKKTLEGGRWESVRIPVIAADGTIHTLLWNSANILSDGAELISTLAHGVDITLNERAEKALRESEKRYRTVVEDQTELISRFTQDGTLTFVNDAYCRYFDLRPEECIGKRHSVVLPPDDVSLMKIHIRSLTLKNPVASIRHRIIMPSGEVRWQRWSDRAIFDKDGHVVEYQSVGRDITDVIKAEDALRGSEARYHNIIEDQTEFICRFLPDGTHIFVNDAYCRYFDKKQEEILGHHFKPVIHPEDREIVARHIASLTPRNPVVSIDQRIVMPDGSTRWQRWSDRAVFDKDGHVVEYQSVGRDITERKAAEEAIRSALEEKEVLHQEIHHRVKNNLAGIISLINLQIGSLTNPLLISQFNDLETRIRSMALVHESLSVTKDHARINIASYTENLTRHLFQIYGKATNIRCRIEMGDVMMPIETAIPCGLVMNEIVTNSLKYAFPKTFSCREIRGEPCTITITLHREGNDYLLRVADNGIGMPEGIDVTMSGSLGLYLIRFIVQHQLRGSREISTMNGTRYTIRFPEPEVKERNTDE
jgi:PAS domain S-box-containing protein